MKNKSVYYLVVAFLSILVIFISVKNIELQEKLRIERYNYDQLDYYVEELAERHYGTEYALDLCKKVVKKQKQTLDDLQKDNAALKESEILIYNKFEELYEAMQEFAIIHMRVVQRLQRCEMV